MRPPASNMAGPPQGSQKKQASLTSFFTQRPANAPNSAAQRAQGPGSNEPSKKRPLQEDTDNGNNSLGASAKRAKSGGASIPLTNGTVPKSAPARAVSPPVQSSPARTQRYAYD